MSDRIDSTPEADVAGRPDRAALEIEPVDFGYGKQPCLQCGYPISDVAGSKAAICPRCGFKDPCC